MSNLAEDNLRFVLLHAMGDAVKKELGRLREGHTSTLVDVYNDTKGTAYKVTLPGTDAVVATVTLRVPKSELELVDDDAFLKWAAANHPDMVELEEIPAVPEQIIPARPAREVAVLNQKKLTEVSKHFTRGGDGEVVDTTTGVFVDGMRWSTAPPPNQFEVRYEGDGRDRISTAYRAGQLNEVVAGSTLGAITAGPVVERRLVMAPPPEPEGQQCGMCSEYVATLSSRGWCDGCESGQCGTPGCGGCMGDEGLPQPEDVDALGPEYGDGTHPLPGEQTVSPARAALEEHADEYVAQLTADRPIIAGGSLWQAADGPSYDEDEPADQAPGEPTDLVDASSHGRLNAAGNWGTPAAAGEPFDPGDW